MNFSNALLEDWMRDYYDNCGIDIGSSGVDHYSFGQIREITGITLEALDNIPFRDSSSSGGLHLRKEIVKNLDACGPHNVMVTHGSSEGIYLALHALLEPGDEVVTMSNSYHTYSSIAQSLACQVNYWSLRSNNKFTVDLEALKKIVTKKTKVIIVNFPHNPTGLTINEDELEELINIAARADAYLFWDGAFSDFVYNTKPLPDPVNFYPKTISVGTLSKSFGLPGLRFGWCITNTELLHTMISLRDRITLALSPLIEFIAYHCLVNIDTIKQHKYQQAVNNLQLLELWVKKNQTFIAWNKPGGGVCSFLRCKHIKDTRQLCTAISSQDLLLVPGDCFDAPDCVRLGFGGSTEQFKQGLSVLETVIQSKTYC